MAKVPSKQGEFLAQLKAARSSRGSLRKFTYDRGYAEPERELRTLGKLESGGSAAKNPPVTDPAPLGQDIPQKLNGRPDLPAIRDDLASQIRANKKRRFG